MGGPLDMHYDDKQWQWVPRRHSCIPHFVELQGVREEIQYSHICLKDARDIDENDLQHLTYSITKPAERAVVIQGYQTMADSMDYLTMYLRPIPCPIIFVWWKQALSSNNKHAGRDLLFSLSETVPKDILVSALINGVFYDSHWVCALRYRGELLSDYAF